MRQSTCVFEIVRDLTLAGAGFPVFFQCHYYGSTGPLLSNHQLDDTALALHSPAS